MLSSDVDCGSPTIKQIQDSAEISAGENHWGHQGPHIKEQTNPAGTDLYPNCWPLAGDGVICLRTAGNMTERATFINRRRR